MNQTDINKKPDYDPLLQSLADYVLEDRSHSDLAYQTAHDCLFDSLGCGLLALQYPECKKLLGPLVPGLTLPIGARIPGTVYRLDPVQAAFNIGTQIRWLDYNDTWLAAEWGHPSDNLGAILGLMDYLACQGERVFTVKDVLNAMIKAYEIQGILALENSFNARGLDHVLLVKLASSAVAAYLLGGSRIEILATLSHAFLDGHSLRTYRHAPNTGSRKSWAAGDASSRAVRLALLVKMGEQGYPSVLSVPIWGFNEVYWDQHDLQVSQSFQDYVMENILFKIAYPAEFHAQTAIEAAIQLHQASKDRVEDIERIEIKTQEAAVRIISKTGPLHNPADRDHCLQYMVAIALLHGDLTADHYEDAVACDPRIDALRNKMQVVEDLQFSRDYLDPNKRAIPNAIQVFFKSGQPTECVQIDYPLGHRRRRSEGKPLLRAKLERHLAHLPGLQQRALLDAFDNPKRCAAMPLTDWMAQWALLEG